MQSEDGFQVVAGKTFDEFAPEKYDALLLPGIINPLPALFDEKNIQFLRGLADQEIVLAAISSSPILLAKAGLLKTRNYTCGLFSEIMEQLDFMPKDTFKPVPLCRDGNLVTAVGFAFREFAVETLKAIGIDAPDTIFGGVKPEDWMTDQLYEMGEAHFAEWTDEYARFQKNAADRESGADHE